MWWVPILMLALSSGLRTPDPEEASISSVQWNADMQQRILRVAYACIGPPVLGLEFFPLPATEGSVVMMRVLDSPDAPHFARKGDVVFIAPRCNGPHTVFMNDRKVERRFRERFQQADNREQRLRHSLSMQAKGLIPRTAFVWSGLPPGRTIRFARVTERGRRL